MVTLPNPIEEFVSRVNIYFGVYMDAIWGFKMINDEATSVESQGRQATPKEQAYMAFTPTEVDSNHAINLSRAEMERAHVNISTALEVIARTSVGGSNTDVISQMVISSIYNLWEDVYREKIAVYLPPLKEKDDLKIPALGDIRHWRRSIVHRNGSAIPEVTRAEIFQWFGEGDKVVFTWEQMLEIKNYFNEQFESDCSAFQHNFTQ